MKTNRLLARAFCLFLVSGSMDARGQESTSSNNRDENQAQILNSLIGTWKGTCRTWLRPGQLADESTIKGEFKSIQGGKLVRHTYEGTINGKPRSGEETIAFNPGEGEFQVSWFDSFHTYGILFSQGERTVQGFSVEGQYRNGPDQKPWGWRTVFEMTDNDHLTITAFNITPDGREGKAVETVYERILHP